jgi:hypothetical protein
VNEDGGGNGGDVVGNDGDRGDKVRGKDVRGILNAGGSVPCTGGLRGVPASPPEDVRAKGLRATPGGCNNTVGWRFVGEAMRLV